MSEEHASRRGWGRMAVAMAVAAGALLASPLAAGAAGTWALTTSPNPGNYVNALSAVTCPGTADCWAVGHTANTGEVDQTLIEQWNGTAWSAVTSGSINAGGGALQENELAAVSCDSTTDCWAVGAYRPVSDYLPLGEHWNGSVWSASPLATFTGSPAPAGTYMLSGIACPDANHCWAVGYWQPDSGGAYILIEQWASGSWTILTPSSEGIEGYFNAISCVDAGHCYAVGGNDSTPRGMLVMSWDGSNWQGGIHPTNQGSGDNTLDGIACVSASYCWAVGYYYATSGEGGPAQDLFLLWDGTSWTSSAVSAANDNSPSENANLLDGVSCVSDTSCWAVGNSVVDELDTTLVDGWNGTSWSLVASTPNVDAADDSNDLNGVACADGSHCAAVGGYGFYDPTLILMYTVTAATAPVPATGGGSPGVDPLLGLVALAAGLAILLAASGPALVGGRRQRDG